MAFFFFFDIMKFMVVGDIFSRSSSHDIKFAAFFFFIQSIVGVDIFSRLLGFFGI